MSNEIRGRTFAGTSESLVLCLESATSYSLPVEIFQQSPLCGFCTIHCHKSVRDPEHSASRQIARQTDGIIVYFNVLGAASKTETTALCQGHTCGKFQRLIVMLPFRYN